MKKKTEKLPGILKNKKRMIVIGIVLVLCMIVGTVIAILNSSKAESTYRETSVVYGSLTVGVTESGTVEVGTVDQTFDLDMSALQRVTTTNNNSSSSAASSGAASMGSFGGSASGGMGGGSMGGSSSAGSMFGQMFNMGSSSGSTTSSSTSSSSKLVVDKIAVSVGQTISEGDVILTLEEEGVEELKEELKNNVEKASADLEALIADQELSTITADYTLSNALTYGEYAEAEKEATINSLKSDVTDAKEALAEAKKNLQRYEEQLKTAQTDYENAVVTMNNAVWARDNTDKNTNLYHYTEAFTTAQSAISNAENLKSKVEQLQEKVDTARSNVTRSQTTLAKANRAYDAGLLSAEENYELRMLAYNTAQETHDITIGYLENSLKEQQENYDDTVSKWDEFTSYIDGNSIRSDYSGVVTSISLAAGDSLTTGAVVVTLYDADAVTMTVSVAEEDMTDIALNGRANVSLTAYPDEVFEAYVSEISDASTDNSGNTTVNVTVSIEGDLSKLFQGMTGEVTFITKQEVETIYVNNRAILRENGNSYVKVKNENGSIEKVKVKTGFSDGVNVQILEGLTEGQTIIIEKGES